MTYDSVSLPEMSVNEILDELERVGVNVEQLRKVYDRKKYINGSEFGNLIKVYQVHVMHRAYKDSLK